MLSDDVFDTDLNKLIASQIRSIRDKQRPKPTRLNLDSDEEKKKKDTWQEVQMKRVVFTPPPAAPVKSTRNELDELACKMHGLDIGDTAYLVRYVQLAYTSLGLP